MNKAAESAINPKRSENFPEWYQQVIKAAEMAENSSVRGCMVLRPWGYGIWELVQRELDDRIKATGHQNAYFPLFIPLSYLQKEADHVEGFAKECAIVTHHRLEERDGKLVPAGELDEPLIVRPTSETIIGESFSKWIQSYRDLPLLINQWCNVVRWEMRTRLFLRTAEFLWQEGHTAHATEAEAREETRQMLEVYQDVMENVLGLGVIGGEKPAHERFPGAVSSLCLEAMMQDRKALQAGTSHYLGQNFAKASDIKFLNQAGETEYAYTTSWGVSTRLIGGMIMTHADDDGLRVPPKVAPQQIIILPITPKPESAASVMEFCDQVASLLRGQTYADQRLRVHVDRRDLRGGEKNWQWVKKGAPLRIEVGPRDVESRSVVVYRRDHGVKERQVLKLDEVAQKVPMMLAEMQAGYLAQSQQYLKEHTTSAIKTFDDLRTFFTPKNAERPEIHGGFARVKLSDDASNIDKLTELKLSVRNLPFDQTGSSGKCVISGKPAINDVIIGKAY